MAKIFEPVTIGTMELKNRIVALPTVMSFADQVGYPTYQMIEAYRKKAEGGAGLIIVEASYMRPDGSCFFGMYGIYTDKMLPYLTGIVEAIHEMGAKACIHIMHGGRQANPRVTKQPLVGPSKHHNPFVPGPAGDARAMSKEEVNQILDQFVESVAFAKDAGFDCVELHSPHGFLTSLLVERSDVRWIQYDPVYEKMWKDMARVTFPEEQEEKVRQIDQCIYEKAYKFFIYSPLTLYAVNKEVNFVPQKDTFLRLKETSMTDNHWSVREEKK